MFSKKPEPSRPGASHSTAKTATFSVIAADVVIRGNIEAATDLHIDGTIEGDIACASLVQGEGSRILGAITCASARLGGTVGGTITVGELAILRSARIEGDVHYATLTVEQGAGSTGALPPMPRAPRRKPRRANPPEWARVWAATMSRG